VAGAALEDVIAVGGVDELVIGVVEILLVHVEPDRRPLDPWRLRRPLRPGWPPCAPDGGGGEGTAPGRRPGSGGRAGPKAPGRPPRASRICASTARPSTP